MCLSDRTLISMVIRLMPPNTFHCRKITLTASPIGSDHLSSSGQKGGLRIISSSFQWGRLLMPVLMPSWVAQIQIVISRCGPWRKLNHATSPKNHIPLLASCPYEVPPCINRFLPRWDGLRNVLISYSYVERCPFVIVHSSSC